MPRPVWCRNLRRWLCEPLVVLSGNFSRMTTYTDQRRQAPIYGHLRGDSTCFLGVLLWSFATIVLAMHMYSSFRPMLIGMWGTPDEWYITRFRPTSARMWLLGEMIYSSWWCRIALLAVAGALWHVQRQLRRQSARILLISAMVLVAASVVFFAFSLLHLTLMPLV